MVEHVSGANMIEIEYTKLLPGRDSGHRWRAALGAFQGTGIRKADSRQALYDAIANEPSDTRAWVTCDAQGRPWVLWRAAGSGWCYATPTGCMSILGGSRDECIRKMCSHMYQYNGQALDSSAQA